MRKLLTSLLLTLLLLSAGLPALAEQRPDVSMMASPALFTRPGEMTVSIRVANTGRLCIRHFLLTLR